MPSDTITLEVKAAVSDPPFYNVKTSDGTLYGFRFTGGDDGHGGIICEPPRSRARQVDVELTGDARFEILRCEFKTDPQQQLSYQARTGSRRAGTITDKNDRQEIADYTIVVKDTQTGREIPCDPPVVNH